MVIDKRLSEFLLIIFPLILFMACSNSDSVEESNYSIIGSWDWYETSGGIGGIVVTPETSEETRKVVFQENGNVTFYTNAAATLSSTYTLSNEKTILSDEELPVVKVEGLDFNYIYSFPYVDELELQEDLIDGFIHKYSKE